MRKIVVGFSGGISSAYCAAWALANYPKEDVILLFHDTKEEDEDTYRFLKEIALKLNHPIIEQSDGRSVTELFYDEGAIANNMMAFCSRILKAEQRDIYFKKLKNEGVTEITLILGFSKDEWKRIQRTSIRAENEGYKVRFPLAEFGISKQECADWAKSLGVCLPRMYTWSGHANCVGCIRGGKNYWLAVKENAPLVFEQRKQLEKEFQHTIIKDMSLIQLEIEGVKKVHKIKESIDIGPCECGD